MVTHILSTHIYATAEEVKDNPLLAKYQATKFDGSDPTSAQSLGKGAFEAANTTGTKPKAYSDFTKKFDNNYQKMGLRR